MTARQLINILLEFDIDEEIEFYLEDDDSVQLKVFEFADDPNCIIFELKGKEN